MPQPQPTDELTSFLASVRKQLPPDQFDAYVKGVTALAEIHAQPYLGKLQVSESGEAYTTFRSQSTPAQIRKGLEVVREAAELPRELELRLLDDLSPTLQKLAHYGSLENASPPGTNYVLEGKMAAMKKIGVCRLLNKFIGCINDWDTDQNDRPFDFIEGLGETGYFVGDRFIEHNHS